MDFRSLIRKPLVRAAFGLLAALTLYVGLMPSPVYAIGAAIPPVYPCPGPTPTGFVSGVSPGATAGLSFQYECHLYDALQELSASYRKTVAFGVVTALLDSATVFTQQLAEQTANWVYSGFDETPQFFTKEYKAFFNDIAADFYNRQIDNLNKSFFKDSLGWDLCQPLSLRLKVGIGIGRMARLAPLDCTFERVKASFNQTKDSLSSDQIANALKQSVAFGGNDINIAISANQKILQDYVDTRQERILDRQEGGGFKNAKDLVSLNIRQPSQVARDTVSESNLLKRLQSGADLSTTVLAEQALVAGIEQLPFVLAGSFVNTFATRSLLGLQKMLQGQQASDPDITVNLFSLDSDPSTESGTAPSTQERRKRIISAFFSDIFRPNLNSGQQQDFTVLMSTCPTPRGLWGCSMDQGLAGVLHSGQIDGGLTVAKAAGLLPGSNTNYLHPDWELIPEWETKDTQDPGCYQRAYCASNLAKMRFARILPVGWELAANSVYNKKTGGKYITLGQVIEGFNNCNSQGQLDQEHPWCKLINPAWVLTAPPFKCSVQGYTDSTLGQGAVTRIRVQECVDVTSCLQRDEDGACIGGYGYCASEKTVWRFGGDQCDEKYASCRSYLKPSKKLGVEPGTPASTSEVVSYVRNSIDYGACSADNSGCMYYATGRDLTTSTADMWRGAVAADWKIVDGTWDKVGTQPASRIYFDNTVKPCTAGDVGCTKLLAMEPQTSALNLLQNSSFEESDDKSSTKLKGWENGAMSAKYVFAGFTNSAGDVDSFSGGVAADFQGSEVDKQAMYQIVPAVGNRYYTISLHGKNRLLGKTGAIQIVAGLLKAYEGVGSKVTGADGKEYALIPPGTSGATFGSDCVATTAGSISGIASNKVGMSDLWDRETCTFVTPKDVTGLFITVQAVNAAVDAAQVEESQTPTGYVDGNNPELEVQYIKVPPEELACVGVAKTDRQECGDYARVCSQIDAGCQAYTEKNGDGSEIPANLSQNDYCPQSCVGYAEYRKQPTGFDLVKNAENSALNDVNDDTIANFIPTNALQCTADAAGCEEFTNVESQAAGGEDKGYFRYVRACEKPGVNSKTFFTWEGSEESGYQLRTWSLIADAGQAVQPKVLLKAGIDGVLKDPKTCTEASWKEGSDLDCRQFYNEAGQVFYTYFSQTVLSSQTCTNYRIAVSNSVDCSQTGGQWNATAQQCIYSVEASQSASCPAQYAGCRGYVGTTGKNTQDVLVDTFGTGASVAGFVKGKVASTGSGSTVSFSKEALLVGDSSLKVMHGVSGSAGIEAPFQSTTGALYMVSFWAKTTQVTPGDSYVAVQDAQSNRLPFRLNQEWKRYEMGPFTTNKSAINTVFLYALPNDTYLDEIRVKQLRDVAYVVKDTWVVPNECDRTPEGVQQPQAMLGCRAYSDRNGKQVNVRQFNNLCKFETVGCTGYVDTRNSESAYSESFTVEGLPEVANPVRKLDNLYSGKVTTIRPADRYVYLIDEPKAHCNPANASCRAFGKPRFDSQWKVNGFDTIYLLDDITKYVKDGEPNALCRPSELFCDAFASNQVVSYFRDPAEHSCTWMDKVTLEAASGAADLAKGWPAYAYPKGQYSGWFAQSGTSTLPCYPYLLSNANTFLTESPFSSRYTGWASYCPKDQSECTEFRDSNDHTDPVKPIGKPYYFIDNSRVDKSSCGGVADPFNGCVLIRNMSDGDLLFNAKATYAESHAKGDISVTPLDCENKDKNNPNCQGVGICSDVHCEGANCTQNAAATLKIGELVNKSCSTDGQCSDPSVNVVGNCQLNDSNRVVKVRLDRDCRAWFGCRSGETVYDDAQQKYVDLCTEYALCDRAGGSSQGNFCSHYVDRTYDQKPQVKVTDPFLEPLLREGIFINDRSYSIRSTSFVDPEYSGYTIGNRFQVADLMSRRVGYELLRTKNVKRANTYFDDYRLVSSVPMIAIGDAAEQAKVTASAYGQLGWAQEYKDPASPTLNLCQHFFTKQIGYYNPGEKPSRCYLAIDTPLTQVVTDVLGAKGSSRGAQTIATVLEQDTNASQSIFMNQLMPGVECKAYPDAQSPFSNDFVKEWDTTVTPNKPKTFTAGYEGVAVCERGEDCSCQYAKVNYQGNVTKYYGVLSQNAPPQGVCVGGQKDGQACIPDTQQKSQAFDPNNPGAPLNNLVNDACGSSSVCQPLQGSSYIRGMSGFCVERDAAVTVGDKGKYQCLIWHPQPVLAGSKDVYHYNPTAGYTPPLNSGEYYCVSPAFAPQSGILVKDASKSFSMPGLSDVTGFTYDERCVTKGYNDKGDANIDGKPDHLTMSTWSQLEVWNSQTNKFSEMDHHSSELAVSSFFKNPGGPYQKAICKNIDGTDLRMTQMAALCDMSPKIESFDGLWDRSQQIGNTDRIKNVAVQFKNAAGSFLNGAWDSVHPPFNTKDGLGTGVKDFFLAPFVGAASFIGGIADAIGCAFGLIGFGESCEVQVKMFNATWTRRVYSRASYSAPSLSIDSSVIYTADSQSMRLVTTGEGAGKSYAEYFIPATSVFTQDFVGQLGGPVAGVGDNLLESQIGYFKLHVPQPKNEGSDYPDEKGWTASINAPALDKLDGRPIAEPFTTATTDPPSADGSTLREHLFGDLPWLEDDTDWSPPPGNPTDSRWYWSWSKLREFSKEDGDFGPVGVDINNSAVTNASFEWNFTTPPTPATDSKVLKNGQRLGQLACLFSPEWVDGTTPSDWENQQEILTKSDAWYKNFNKNFSGYLSRSKQGFLKTQDGAQLQQLPCQNNPASNCYYKFWETGYQDEAESKFNIFNLTDGAKGPVQIKADQTYFRKANGQKQFFSVRAMFEDMNADDNKTPALQQANDGSGLRGPFRFVGFWVTAAAPGTASSRFIYMRVSSAAANTCRDVAQVVSPKDRSNAAFTDRVWEQSNFQVPLLGFTYGTENAPFGAALHQRMIGHDPMLMLDTSKGIAAADGTFIKPGQQYWAKSRISDVEDRGFSHYHILSNLFARVYQVYQFYDVPVGPKDNICFFGPYAGRRCNSGADCDANSNVSCVKEGGTAAVGNEAGTCKGGFYNGRDCTGATETQACKLLKTPLDYSQSCQPVEINGVPNSYKQTVTIQGSVKVTQGADCKGVGDPNSTDPDKDDNRCTHNVGYYPKLDLCYFNPDNIECLKGPSTGGFFLPESKAHAATPPTDVTLGHLAMDYNNVAVMTQGVTTKGLSDVYYRDDQFTSSYFSRPPRVAAPDTARQCASPGQCAIARMDALNIDNSTEGPIVYYGSQSYVTMRFYAWGADNQSPLSDVWIDWGDGSMQRVSEARMKNKKPFCGVSKQCELAPGLTCNSDADCPAGGGKCYGTGFCSNNSGRSCRVGLAGGSDCEDNGACVERLTYGSSPLACEANFFEFKHSYTCTETSKPTGTCNGFVSGGKGGCSMTSPEIKTTCKFVPRVFVKDNWGWCAGDCSQKIGTLNKPPKNTKDAMFRNGGCYDGSQAQTQVSVVGKDIIGLGGPNSIGINMCDAEATKSGAVAPPSDIQPWIPYAGVIEMRSPE